MLIDKKGRGKNKQREEKVTFCYTYRIHIPQTTDHIASFANATPKAAKEECGTVGCHQPSRDGHAAPEIFFWLGLREI